MLRHLDDEDERCLRGVHGAPRIEHASARYSARSPAWLFTLEILLDAASLSLPIRSLRATISWAGLSVIFHASGCGKKKG